MVTVKCKRIHDRESVMNIQDLAKINQQELRDFFLSSEESMLYTDYKYLSLLQEHLSCDIKYLVHYEGSKGQLQPCLLQLSQNMAKSIIHFRILKQWRSN